MTALTTATSSTLRCRRGGLPARRAGGGAVCGLLPLPFCHGFAAPLALLLLCSDAPFCAGDRRWSSTSTRLLAAALLLLLLLMQVAPALLRRDPAVGG